MNQQLRQVAEQYWDTVLEFSPSTATLLGDHRFDDRIEDLSVAAEQQALAAWRRMRYAVEAIDAGGLDSTARIIRTLLLDDLDRASTELEWRPAEMGAGHMDGVHARLLTTISQITAPGPREAAALTRRHRQIDALLDTAMHRFRDGLAAGRTPARVTIERSLNQLDGYLATALSTDPFTTVTGPVGWDGEQAWRQELSTTPR